jgi:hypothetical protein
VKLASLLAGLAAFAAGCGAGEAPSPPAAAPPPPAPPPAAQPVLYEATATVLEAPGAGPMLCLGGIRESYPPQCGDVPLAGWSWDAVDGEETAAGVTWGDFHVVGKFDGETFAVSATGPARPAPEPDDDRFEPPCPEPEGGWVAAEPGAGSQDDVGPAQGYATRQPDYAASWVYHLGAPAEGEYEEDLPVVYVAVFTRDAARHEAEIRTRWAGPLCVVERDVPSAGKAARIRAEAEASLEGLGLRMLSSWEGELGLAAEIQVVADPGGVGQAALDERFGPGLVRLVPALRPVG